MLFRTYGQRWLHSTCFISLFANNPFRYFFVVKIIVLSLSTLLVFSLNDCSVIKRQFFLKICPKKSYVQLKTNVCEKAYSKNPSFRNQILLENSFFINKSIKFPSSMEQFLIIRFLFVFKTIIFQFSEQSISFVYQLFFILNNILFHKIIQFVLKNCVR